MRMKSFENEISDLLRVGLKAMVLSKQMLLGSSAIVTESSDGTEDYETEC